MAHTEETRIHAIPPRVGNGYHQPHVGPNIHAYKALYNKTVGPGSDEWWAKMARETLYWDHPFHTVRMGSFKTADIAWFLEGALNASYNCVDRWAAKDPDKTAIIYQPDDPSDSKNISYAMLLREVCCVANVLKTLGVRKGDIVTVYMPMTWYTLAACLACARIGAVHSVVFWLLPKTALQDRIRACKSPVVITSNRAMRRGESKPVKATVDTALEGCPTVKHTIVLKRTDEAVPMTVGRDLWWHEETAKVPKYCPPETMASEDVLFIIYTSGTTGKPKGIVHTTGGYLLCAALTVKYAFDVHSDDIFCCMADMSWMVAHTCTIYGSLCLGITVTVFESTVNYPNPSRYWETVDRHKITHLYSAPTAPRVLSLESREFVDRCNLDSLRVLGTVGEPLSPSVWHWYNDVVGKKQCAVLDTYGQTETASLVLTPFPGAIQTRPGCVTVPFLGQEPAILDPATGKELTGNDVSGVLVLKTPWPSVVRTLYQNHELYTATYLEPYPGMFYTGDFATRDADGYFWIRGRCDDIINVAGHRFAAGELEQVLKSHRAVGDCAVVASADDRTGQTIHAFITLRQPAHYDKLDKELRSQACEQIGAFAEPTVYVVNELPKNFRGKVLRPMLRKLVSGTKIQTEDLTEVANPNVIRDIINRLG